jgi:hypothetical protein
MKQLILIIVLLVTIFTIQIQSFASNNTTFSEDDIRTIQNDSIVPRKIIANSNELFKLNEGIFKGNLEQDAPVILLRNIALVLFGVFLLIQIIMVLVGKISVHLLSANFIKALIMNVGVITIIIAGIAITNSFTSLFGMDKNFTVNTVRSMQLYVTSKEERDKIMTMSNEDVLKNNFNTPSLTYTGLTGDIFCLKTIQDQYRVANLILNWITLVLTYFNWLILLIADVVLKVCLFLSPFIGYLYIFGDRFSVINKFWTIFWDSALAKSLFYIVYGVITLINNQIVPILTNNIINLEYAFFVISSLIALSITTFTFRDIFKIDGAIKVFNDQINNIQSKL